VYRNQPLGGRAYGGDAEHDNHNHAFRMSGDGVPALQLGGFGFQVGGLIGRYLYLGGEMEVTLGSNPGGTITQGTQVLRPRGAVSVGGFAVAGVWVPVSRALRLRAEVAAGGRFVSMGYESTFGACVADASVSAHQLAVEPRGGVEWFVTPWTSLGASMGADVLNPGQVSAGLTLRVHARAYDGVE